GAHPGQLLFALDGVVLGAAALHPLARGHRLLGVEPSAALAFALGRTAPLLLDDLDRGDLLAAPYALARRALCRGGRHRHRLRTFLHVRSRAGPRAFDAPAADA